MSDSVTWVERGRLAALGDPDATNLARNDTEFRKELRKQSQLAIGDAPDVTAAAVAKVNEVVAGLGVVKSDSGVVNSTRMVVQDKDGNDTWVQSNSSGLPTDEAKWAVVNSVGAYAGPDQPFVYPGRAVLWFSTVTRKFALVEG